MSPYEQNNFYDKSYLATVIFIVAMRSKPR